MSEESMGRGAHARFPLWIEWSGLPRQLNEATKLNYAWAVFRRLVEFDMEHHAAAPATLEISPETVAAACGLSTEHLRKAAKALREKAVLRMFYPEDPMETGLFEIIAPLKTPRTADEVRAQFPDRFVGEPWPPRYAVAPDPEELARRTATTEGRIKRTIELYFNTFSMKMNSLILDELRIVATNYEPAIVEKVFRMAKEREARSLGWIVSEILKEQKYAAATPPHRD